MKLPFISVIIPTLNEEKYIENTLKALRKQNYKGKYEIILADGLSTDNTLKIAKKYVNRIVSVKKKGIGAGRNAGARVAKGDIFLFIDADTIPSPNLLSALGKAYQDDNVVSVTCKIYSNSPRKSVRAIYKAYNKFVKFSIKIKRAAISGICNSYRRSTFEFLGGFNERLSTFEDYDLSLKTNKMGKVVFLKDSYVITSGRRIESWGILKTLINYTFYHIRFFAVGSGFPPHAYKPIR